MKNVAALVTASAMFAVVRAKLNAARHHHDSRGGGFAPIPQGVQNSSTQPIRDDAEHDLRIAPNTKAMTKYSFHPLLSVK